MSETELQRNEPTRRNFKYNRAGGVDCELNHPTYGWIPYTLGPDETVPDGEVIADVNLIPVEVLRADVEQQRLAAYANPMTGSDRLFAEAQRMQMMDESGWEEVRDAAIARYEEIKLEHPWPVKDN